MFYSKETQAEYATASAERWFDCPDARNVLEVLRQAVLDYNNGGDEWAYSDALFHAERELAEIRDEQVMEANADSYDDPDWLFEIAPHAETVVLEFAENVA